MGFKTICEAHSIQESWNTTNEDSETRGNEHRLWMLFR